MEVGLESEEVRWEGEDVRREGLEGSCCRRVREGERRDEK